MTSTKYRICTALLFGFFAATLTGCRHQNHIHLVRNGMGMVTIAPEPGDLITWGQIDENTGKTDTLDVTYNPVLGSPCAPGDPAWKCRITDQSKEHFFLYTCAGCQDPGIMPGTGTGKNPPPGPTGNAAKGLDSWDPVIVSCVNGTANTTPAIPSPTKNLQWVANHVKFKVVVAAGICTQGALTVTERTPFKVCTIQPAPPPNPTYSLHVDECGPDHNLPIGPPPQE